MKKFLHKNKTMKIHKVPTKTINENILKNENIFNLNDKKSKLGIIEYFRFKFYLIKVIASLFAL